jgi:hypothetical protein
MSLMKFKKTILICALCSAVFLWGVASFALSASATDLETTLQVTEEDEEANYSTVRATNLREYPGSGYGSYCLIPANTTLYGSVVSNGAWLATSYGGYSGYVSMNDIMGF